MTRPRTAIAVLVAVLLAGCGSTVQERGSVSAGSGALPGDGLGTSSQAPSSTDPSVDEPVGLPAGRAQGSSAGPSAPSDSGTPATGPRSTSSQAPTTTQGLLPARHKGVDAKTIKVGFLHLAGAGTVVGGLGVSGYSQGDEKGEMQALVADQNKRGGIAGRKIVLVPHDLGGLDSSAYQSACTFFTQDTPVFMVLTALGHSDLLSACLAKKDVGFSSDYTTPSDRSMRGLGPIYAPDDLSLERYAVLLGRGLIAAGFFGKGAKVGIVRSDSNDYTRVTEQVLRPILATAGVNVVAEETYNAADTADTVGGAGGAMFRLRQLGVTHVVMYDSPLFHMTAADSQKYYPFWSVGTRSGAGSFLEGAAPRSQLRKSLGPGWQPVADLNASQQTKPLNSEEARCQAILRKAGYDLTGAPRYVAEMLCGELFHFVKALGEANEVSTQGFRTAAEHLTSYVSPTTFATSFAGGRHDGAAKYRIVSWNEACSCFRYTSPLRDIPSS
jgi:hypothetical protein